MFVFSQIEGVKIFASPYLDSYFDDFDRHVLCNTVKLLGCHAKRAAENIKVKRANCSNEKKFYTLEIAKQDMETLAIDIEKFYRTRKGFYFLPQESQTQIIKNMDKPRLQWELAKVLVN